MSWKNKVVWSEGMFMRPQHFQQHVRYMENFIEARCSAFGHFGWGFRSLQLDLETLSLGKIAIKSACGILPDGTPFNIPHDEDPPPALEVDSEARDQMVYLALPNRRAGMVEFDGSDGLTTLARYRPVEIDVLDSNAGSDTVVPLEIGTLRLRLLMESAVRDDFVHMGIARIREIRPDKQILLDDEYILPTVSCHVSTRLASFITELRGILHQRGEVLAGRVSESGKGGAAEIASFLFLQLVNRYEPLLAHVDDVDGFHPQSFYSLALEMAGELATFNAPRRPPQFPAYRHDDLKGTFEPVIIELRRSLSREPPEVAVPIPLEERRYGIKLATISNRSLLEKASFVLAVKASLPTDQVYRYFPQVAKVAPVEEIKKVVNGQLRGIGLLPLAVAPRQIPFHAGHVYFELDRTSQYWEKLQNSGAFALHVPSGKFPDLVMEFWAIKGQ